VYDILIIFFVRANKIIPEYITEILPNGMLMSAYQTPVTVRLLARLYAGCRSSNPKEHDHLERNKVLGTNPAGKGTAGCLGGANGKHDTAEEDVD
jgi:hypothetical protein